MSKKRSNRNGTFNTYETKNVEFSLEERIAINSWLEGRSRTFVPLLFNLLDIDFKFSISRDQARELYLVSVTDKRSRAARAKKPVYLLRHADLEKLLGITAYFFTETLQGGESEPLPAMSEHDW